MTVGSLDGSGATVLTNGVALIAGGDNTSSTYSGAMSGVGSLVKVGNGTMTISGFNTYAASGNATDTNDTTVMAGRLVIGPTGTVGGGAALNNTYVPAGTLEVDGALITKILNVTANPDGSGQGTGQLAGNGMITMNADGLYYNSSATSTFAGTMTGPGAVEVDGGALILIGSNTNAGGTTAGGGYYPTVLPTLVIGSSSAIPYVVDPITGNVDVASGLFVGADGTVIIGMPENGQLGAGIVGAGSVIAVPEPGTLALLGVVALLAAAAWRKNKRS